MKFRGGEFSTGTMRNFQPELTLPRAILPYGCRHSASQVSQFLPRPNPYSLSPTL